ncbi:MAG TPA: hypothetical protein VFD23_03525 [Clostridia bacterium]|nr:hypothetical protein [Clostridia bacterium]
MQNKWRDTVLKMTQFLYGRNGFDKLSGFLLITGMLVNGVNSVIRRWWPSLATTTILSLLSFLLLVFAVFRIMSRNVTKRRTENFKFENLLKLLGVSKILSAITRGTKNLSLRIRYRRTHRFRRCPNCKNFLRLTKKKGKREIDCPRCAHKMKIRIWI